MDVEFLGEFLDGLDRLKRHAGFEFGMMAFAFHFVCVRFGLQSAPTHHNHRLATGPISGVRLISVGTSLCSSGWLSAGWEPLRRKVPEEMVPAHGFAPLRFEWRRQTYHWSEHPMEKVSLSEPVSSRVRIPM